MALSYGQALMDNLQERSLDALALDGHSQASWARVIAQHDTRDGGPFGIYGSQGPSYRSDIFSLQAGADLYRGQDNSGSDAAGVYIAAGQIAGDVKHFDGSIAGHDRLQNLTLGGYWTHVGPSGWYTDAVVQGTSYKITASSTRMAPLRTGGRGVAASFEGGYPIPLPNGWVFVPQAQLVYQHDSFNEASDAASNVYFGNANAMAGRAGTEVRKNWFFGNDPSRPKALSTWLRVDMWREFMAAPAVAFSTPTMPVSFSSDLKRSWVGLRTGISSQLAPHVYLYASAGYDVGINDRGHSYSGKMGVRINW
jgi:outer membrane autotransporter protein